MKKWKLKIQKMKTQNSKSENSKTENWKFKIQKVKIQKSKTQKSNFKSDMCELCVSCVSCVCRVSCVLCVWHVLRVCHVCVLFTVDINPEQLMTMIATIVNDLHLSHCCYMLLVRDDTDDGDPMTITISYRSHSLHWPHRESH